MSLSESDKKLLAWALDCALTKRDKVGMLQYNNVMKAAKNAIDEPAIKEHVLKIVDIISPETASSIRQFLKL